MQVISVREGNSFIQLIPGSSSDPIKRLSVGIDHTEEAPIIGCQWGSWSPSDAVVDHWRWNIAPARPYVLSPQVISASCFACPLTNEWVNSAGHIQALKEAS